MLSKRSCPAILALVLSAAAAQGQSLAQLGGPANLPPASFTGQQFVDNRGCLFMRAGLGANLTWVPRVDAGHSPICGYPPTFAAATLRAVEAAMAPDPEAGPAEIAAPAAALQPLALTQVAKPPKGYKLAWKDDRLNPLRGIGTAQGQAQQDLVWTRDIPARPVATKPAQRVTVSTMSAPTQSLAGGQALVQVGAFGDPANAARVQAQLAALGLPVTTASLTRQGRVLTVVYAGPFAARPAALAGLQAARSAGFADAVLRMTGG